MKPFRTALVLFLLLTYGGQALAAFGTPCFMMAAAAGRAAADAAPAAMSGAEHTGHHMAGAHMDGAGQADDSADHGDCCEGGFCSMSHCQSVAALPQAPLLAAASPGADVHHQAIPPVYPGSPDTLYRPPIHR